MLTALLVAAAGAIGVLTRFGLSALVQGDAALWTTLGINVAGSFLLGLLVAVEPDNEPMRTALGAGFLGGFTTYSTFSVQATQAALGGRIALAASYVTLTVVLGLLAAAAGHGVGRLMR